MSTKTKKSAGKASRSAIQDVVAREYTIHMHKRVGGSYATVMVSRVCEEKTNFFC
jgi:hypothetical protein